MTKRSTVMLALVAALAWPGLAAADICGDIAAHMKALKSDTPFAKWRGG